MRNVVLVCAMLALGVTAQQETAQGTVVYESEISTRTLPADVLRDFPGMCFGSTTCRAYPEGATWELGAFCGRATCVKNETGFFEKVEDCGPVADPNENCRAAAPDARLSREEAAIYPNCCPKYECAKGATLHFPTEEEIKARIEQARTEHEAKLKAQAAEATAQA